MHSRPPFLGKQGVLLVVEVLKVSMPTNFDGLDTGDVKDEDLEIQKATDEIMDILTGMANLMCRSRETDRLTRTSLR